MKAYIETYQNNKQILGSDFTTVINNPTEKKIKNAIKLHLQKIESLKTIKPFLNNGYKIKINN